MSLLLRGEIRVVDGGVYNICISDSRGSLIVDAVNSVVNSEYAISDTSRTTDLTVENKQQDDFAKISFLRTSSTDIGDINTTHAYGALRWARDDVNGPAVGVYMQGGSDGYKLFSIADGVNYVQTSSLHFDMAGNLGIGKHQPTEKLDVNGNTTITGFVQFGRLTTQERDQLNAANGMVIYNTVDDKFQGYQGGKWINLDTGSDA